MLANKHYAKSMLYNSYLGGVTERLMVAVLKTAVSLCGTVGSNPTPSVFFESTLCGWNVNVNRSAN